MECGVPFCHHGCPLGNLIPDWNDLVYRDRWREAIDQLHRTNNFPEFTGRLCPAPCEAACVLEIREGDAVTIKQIEVVDRRPRLGGGLGRAAPAGAPHRPHRRRDRRPARPASRARSSCNRAGHAVTVFERDEAGGGPRAVRGARVQDREAARSSGGSTSSSPRASSSATASTSASTSAPTSSAPPTTRSSSRRARACRATCRCPGRELDGVHFAMDYLYDRARAIAAEVGTAGPLAPPPLRAAADRGREARDRDRRRRHGRRLRRERPPRAGCLGDPDRGARRAARAAAGRPDAVAALADEAPHLVCAQGGRRARLRDLDDPPLGLRRQGRADPLGAQRRRAAVRAAPGDRGVAARRARPPRDGLPPSRARACSSSSASSATRAATPRRPTYATSVDGVFAAGDARRGQSLIVWAINEGRQCAEQVDRWLAQGGVTRVEQSCRRCARRSDATAAVSPRVSPDDLARGRRRRGRRARRRRGRRDRGRLARLREPGRRGQPQRGALRGAARRPARLGRWRHRQPALRVGLAAVVGACHAVIAGDGDLFVAAASSR